MGRTLIILPALLWLSFVCKAQTRIKAVEAGQHIGDSVMVREKVIDHFMTPNHGIMILYTGSTRNFLTIVLKSDDLVKYKMEADPIYYSKKIAVTGIVENIDDNPCIVIKTPGQIKILR
ncbi:MAG: hypothetical protein ABIX36_04605 [Mucilaginibacter sp.]|uniref:hypothetical protein n=1 Tax=Mucilaginibacter sp. TaxID=1882438 RepID=UPI003267C57F